MINILIVDDEAIEREALQKIMEKRIEGIRVVGQAENGKRAIELACELTPDLILMDIQMPEMGGFEAIEQIIEHQPKIKFIMITAYDTFEYAVQAIRMSVRDYLLKPSKAQVIVDTVQKVVSEIHIEKQLLELHEGEQHKIKKLLPIVETDLVTQLLFDHVHEVHLDEMLRLLSINENNPFFVIVITILQNECSTKTNNPITEEAYLQTEDLYHVVRAVKEQFHQSANGWVGPMSGGQIPIVVFNDLKRTYRSQAISISQKIQQLAHTWEHIQLYIGIGSQYNSLEEVRSSYQEALLASIDTDLPVKHRFYEAVIGGMDEHLISADTEKRIIEEARRGNWTYIKHDLLQIIHRYEAAGKSAVESQQKVYELLFVVSRLMLDMGVQVELNAFFLQMTNYQLLEVQIINYLNNMQKAYLSVKNQLEPDVMRQIKQYIREHAHKNISLESISETVQLSPYYVSKMFKEQFGTNYIDYLTDCRIEKAKEYLGDSDKSLKEITFDIGYNDPNYFSRVFKKMTGLSPTEYRKELITKKRS